MSLFGGRLIVRLGEQLVGLGESVTFLVPEGEILGKARSDISDAEMIAGLKVFHLIVRSCVCSCGRT